MLSKIRIRKLLLILLLASIFSRAEVLHEDKAMHILVGGIIYYSCIIINEQTDYNMDEKYCLIPPLVASISKEIYDQSQYGGFDLEDIGATMAIPMISFTVAKW